MGSKNNPMNRGVAKVKTFGGKKIKPAKLMRYKKSAYMVAVYEDGNLVTDTGGNPIPYGEI